MLEDYQVVYENFWKEIVEDENGIVNMDQVARELADFRVMIDNVPRIYEEISGLSKPLTDPKYILAALEERYVRRDHILHDVMDMSEKGMIKLQDMIAYLS